MNSKKANKTLEVEEEVEEIELPNGENDGEGAGLNLSPSIIRRLTALRKLHSDVGDIDAEYKAERIVLEAKFKAKRSVIYEERKRVITGAVEVPELNPGIMVEINRDNFL
jgi:hypothetical protein